MAKRRGASQPLFSGLGSSRTSGGRWRRGLRSAAWATSAVALYLVASGEPVAGGVNRWTSNGPYGGWVTALGVDPAAPETVFAGFARGSVYRSDDLGGSWRPAVEPPDAAVYVFAIVPGPATIYAGTSNGLWKSLDGGQTWGAINGGPGSRSVEALVLDPSSMALYAGSTGAGVLESRDGGDSWAEVNEGLGDLSVRALAIEPSTSTLYAGTYDEGLFRRGTADDAWRAINDGLPCPGIRSLWLDPSTPGTLYAGTRGGVFKTTDGGASWTSRNDGLPLGPVAHLAGGRTEPATIYAAPVSRGVSTGVFESTDGGASWRAANEGLPGLEVWALAVAGASSSDLFVGTESGGVFRRPSGGAWSPRTRGLSGVAAGSLAVDTSQPNVLYAAGSSGVFRSEDGGGAWERFSPHGLGLGELTIAPSEPTTLYAASLGLYKRTAETGGWVRIGDPSGNVADLAVDPGVPTTLYAATTGGGMCDCGVSRSTDGGESWHLVHRDVAWSLAIAPADPETVYAGVSHGIRRSTDGGESWEDPSDGGLTDRVIDVAIDPATPSVLFAVTSESFPRTRVLMSTDGGGSWQERSAGLDEVSVLTLAIDPLVPTTLYAATRIRGVYRSIDGGASWLPLPGGLRDATVYSLAIPRQQPSRLFAGTRMGVFDIDLVHELSLHDGRFRVEVDWRTSLERSGPGGVAAVPETSAAPLRSLDSAVLEFFAPDNWELLIKVLDGRVLTDHFWVFLAAATDVEYTVTVTDTSCGDEWITTNPLGRASPAVTDTSALPGCDAPARPSCSPSADVLCLGEDGRFRVTAAWREAGGTSGTAREANLPQGGLAESQDSGLFFFFHEDNWELLVKVLDGCGLNRRFWVFAAATTDVEYTLRVTDTMGEATATYLNPLGEAADAITDTGAFSTCDVAPPGR